MVRPWLPPTVRRALVQASTKLLDTPVEDFDGNRALDLRIKVQDGDICVECTTVTKHDASAEGGMRHDETPVVQLAGLSRHFQRTTHPATLDRIVQGSIERCELVHTWEKIGLVICSNCSAAKYVSNGELQSVNDGN